jgi:hypothetical protein
LSTVQKISHIVCDFEKSSMIKSAPGYAVNRARISLALSQFTVPLLSRIYAAFDGDMLSALVMGEIAHRNVESWLAKHENPEAPLYDPIPERRERLLRPCNALSIADACGLPRETVRRKVVHLIERGFIYRSPEGYLFLALDVGDHFEDMTVETIENLLRTATALRVLLDQEHQHRGPAAGSNADAPEGPSGD